MDALRACLRRLSYVVWQFRHDAELREEIEAHRSLRQAHLEQEGMAPALAYERSRQAMGNVFLAREEAREAWLGSAASWAQDLEYGVRLLRRGPGVAVLVVLTMAVGIGLNAAVFSVFEAAHVRPLGYPDADRLVWIATYDSRFQRDTFVSRSDFLTWRAGTASFERMAAYGDQEAAVLTRGDATERRITSVTSELWGLTGAKVVVGRLFGPDEEDVAVLSHGMFEREFGSDPSVIGSSVALNGHPVTIVGVLAREYRFQLPPLGDVAERPALYIPLPHRRGTAGLPDPQPTGDRPVPPWVRVVATLAPGVSVERAAAELRRVHGKLLEEYSAPLRAARQSYGVRVAPLQEKLTGHVETALTILLAAVSFVFAMATTNVALLLLARATSRRSEVAIRLALGAGRVRIVRQWLAESLVLAVVGCIGGLALANWGIDAMVGFWPDAIPRLEEAAIDAPVLALAVVATFVSALAFGAGPALAFVLPEITIALGHPDRGASATPRVAHARRVLVGLELAFATVLLIAAGLTVKSYWVMSSGGQARDPERILVTRVTLSGARYGSRLPQEQYVDEVLRRLEGMPGAASAGVDAGSFNAPVAVDGIERSLERDQPFAAVRPVSLGALRVLGVPLTRGRWPSTQALAGDAVESVDAILVNERFVAVVMRGEDPVGRHIRGASVSGTIAGVVGDVKEWALDAEPLPQVYVPYKRATALRAVRILVRAEGDPAALAPVIRQRLAAIDSTQAITDARTLDEVLGASAATPRFHLTLLSVFAVVAVLLALTGAYGVIAHSVALRTREIGVRLALGAAPAALQRMVMRHEMVVALVGIATGLAASLVLAPVMDGLLYGVTVRDPWTFVAAASALACGALLTAWAAARTVATVDPMIVLQRP